MSCCQKSENKPFTDYSLIKAGASIIKHFTNSSYNAFVEDEIKIERLKACSNCKEMDEIFNKRRCKLCMCFLDAKASLVDQDCPYPQGSKWQKL